MNQGNSLRMLVAAAIVLWVFGGGIRSASVAAPYAGPMSRVHDASRSMAAGDRAALSETLQAAGEMLAADRVGMVSTTEELQRYVKAATEFDYLALGTPNTKYPAVAEAIQAELAKAAGTDVAKLTPAMRDAAVAAMVEAGKAVR
jgi:hypothetical protein